jgi:excisionase family DNA binding protein
MRFRAPTGRRFVMAETDEFWSSDYVAALVGLTRNTLEKWRVRGQGPPFVKLGGRVRYRRSDVLAWIEENTKAATTA